MTLFRSPVNTGLMFWALKAIGYYLHMPFSKSEIGTFYWPALDMLQRANALKTPIHHNSQPGTEGFTFFHAEKPTKKL